MLTMPTYRAYRIFQGSLRGIQIQFSQPGACTAAINYYRHLFRNPLRPRHSPKIENLCLYIQWNDCLVCTHNYSCRKANCNMLIGTTANIFQGMKKKTCNRKIFSPRIKSNIRYCCILTHGIGY